MRTTPALAICCFSLVAASCSSELPRGRHESGVINGDLDEDDPAVVALMDGNYFFCSGTVISPHVILTAAHCLEGGPPPSGIFFGTDSNDPSSGTVVPVRAVLAHPQYGQDHDLGVVELMAATPVTPAALNTTALTAGMAGQDVRVVGFGLSVDDETSNEAGVKRTGLTTLDSLEADYMLVTPKGNQSGCYGDSGGPNFMTLGGTEVLAGITSFGTEDSCLAGYGGNTDVQKYLGWIDDYVTMVEGGATGPTCGTGDGCLAGCSTPDPDCPVDPGPGDDDDDTGDDTGGDDGGAGGGGCSAGGGGGAGLALIALLAVIARKNRWARPRLAESSESRLLAGRLLR